MTTKTVLTLTELQLRFLRASVSLMLSALAETERKASKPPVIELLVDAAIAETDADLLYHEDGQDLLTLLELAESVELSATDTTADDDDDDEPMSRWGSKRPSWSPLPLRTAACEKEPEACN